MTIGDQRLKVLHVATTSAGGLGVSVMSIIRALDPARYQVDVALGLGYPLDAAFEPAGFRLHGLELGRGLHPWQFARTVWRLTRLMRRERFAVVHVHGSEAGILARVAVRLSLVPTVVIAELHGYANRDPDSILERTLYRWIEQSLDRMTDAYVAVSAHVQRQWLARGVCAPNRITVIHHALDLTAYPDPGPRSDEAQVRATSGNGGQRLESPRRSPVVGSACLLEKRKGLIEWVEAMPEIVLRVPGVRFAVVGEGPLRPQMEQRAAELGVADRIDFLGWREDVSALMRRFDCFVLPSRRESFGLVLIEAMANRCPVVASRVDGIPEVIEDGVTGTLVTQGDISRLADAVTELLIDRAKALGFAQAGRKRVETHFESSRMARDYNRLYARLLDKAPAPGADRSDTGAVPAAASVHAPHSNDSISRPRSTPS